MITTDSLPSTRWRCATDVDLLLDLPPAGVLIGADEMLKPVVLPAVGPGATRLGVLGDQRIAALLAYRLLGVGSTLAVVTADPARWRALLVAAGARAVISSNTAGWPPATEGPHTLVSDLPTPPPLSLGDRPLCAVVHTATEVPHPSPFWEGIDGVVVAGTGHGGALARALGRADAVELDGIGSGRLGVLDRHRVVAVTPILAEAERALLLGG